eukprot:TRINITY_DN1235_c0_g3_i6.p1 TRINITY_DN1235_c0_g3~~TRINITY_DN1235_c0_g3_i6.p1  ORF type:complete len:329 (+),score=74.45 TRINITY_DN1235_c0_g3_i6:296-1282(+)
MHEAGIIHGQITPHKILLMGAKFYLYDPCVGTESVSDRIAENFLFLSPEELAGEVPSFESEVWSLGAVFYYLVSGEFVLAGRTCMECLETARKSEVGFRDLVWTAISPALKDMVQRMLVYDKTLRINMSEVLQHEWMQSDENCLPNVVVSSLKKMSMHQRRRRCMQHSKLCIANTKSYSAVYDMQKTCQQLDFNKTGYLEYGLIIRSVLKGDDTQCEDCECFWGHKVHHQNFVADAIVLNSLVYHERVSVLFEQLSKKKPFVGPEEIKKMLRAVAHPEYTSPEVFDKFVGTYQHVRRAELTLNFAEFIVMCQSINFIPNEGHIIGKFF